MAEHRSWRIWTEPGSLVWADPGDDRPSLRSAIEDCADTLAPVGHTPNLSTHWLDRLLAGLDAIDDGDIAHGNLWVLTRVGPTVEIRMDIDHPSSEPLETISAEELRAGIEDLRAEVVRQLAAGHQLDERYWPQRNPG